MLVVAYILVSATVVLGLYSATAPPTPKLAAQAPRHIRTQRPNETPFAGRPQPNLTHINCLS
jgi:hypothetical protein